MATEYPLKWLAEKTNGRVVGDGAKKIGGVAPFDLADEHQVTFAVGKPYLKRIADCSAGAVFVPAGCEVPKKNLVQVDNPQLAFAKVVRLFHPTIPSPPGISEQACVGVGVQIEELVSIGAFTTVGDRVRIGSGTVVKPHVFIGNDVEIGDQVTIFPNVTILDRCRIGNRVTIHPGTVIGSDGYGFVPDQGCHHKIPQIGMVQIDDDVEIGACNTIDRATFGRTWIRRGVKTDNLVHIAHNVVVGEDSLIVAQVGIAGSTKVGHHAVLAGQAGISGHLSIGNHVTVGPMTGVSKSIPDGQVVSSGMNAMPHRTWLRVQRIVPSLPDLLKTIADLEKKVASLQKNSQTR